MLGSRSAEFISLKKLCNLWPTSFSLGVFNLCVHPNFSSRMARIRFVSINIVPSGFIHTFTDRRTPFPFKANNSPKKNPCFVTFHSGQALSLMLSSSVCWEQYCMKQITSPLSNGAGKLPRIRIVRSYGSSLFSFISFFWSSRTILLEFQRELLTGKLCVIAPTRRSMERETKPGCLNQASMGASHVVTGSFVVGSRGWGKEFRTNKKIKRKHVHFSG